MSNPKYVWSEADDAFLLENFPSMHTRDVAAVLGRSIDAVTTRARNKGIKKTSEFMQALYAARAKRGERIPKVCKYCKKTPDEVRWKDFSKVGTPRGYQCQPCHHFHVKRKGKPRMDMRRPVKSEPCTRKPKVSGRFTPDTRKVLERTLTHHPDLLLILAGEL